MHLRRTLKKRKCIVPPQLPLVVNHGCRQDYTVVHNIYFSFFGGVDTENLPSSGILIKTQTTRKRQSEGSKRFQRLMRSCQMVCCGGGGVMGVCWWLCLLLCSALSLFYVWISFIFCSPLLYISKASIYLMCFKGYVISS